MTDQPLQTAVVAAFLIESVVNLLLTIYKYEPGLPWHQCFNWKVLLSIAVGEMVAFGFNLDIFSIVGLAGSWWLGVSLTGLLLSRGSNFLHDAVEFIRNLKQKASAEKTALVSDLTLYPKK